ncbi:MAG: hypothetical protein NC548_49000 [Lachnospiraceae bacterium]|nr:hypothetical protein [Lachnospiraceae bacterium]
MSTERMVKLWACDKCGKLYQDKYVADICCKGYHCEVCGRETQRFILKCESCQEKARFAQAKKMTVKEYEAAYPGNMVFWGGEYYASVDDLLERLEEDGVPLEDVPKYCYGTTRFYMRLDPVKILDDIQEEADCEDIAFSDEAYREFKEFAKKWNEKHEEYCFYWDNELAILIPDELKKDWANG